MTAASAASGILAGRAVAPPRRTNPLVEVVAQLAGSGWVAQLAQRLRLDLADAFAGHIELRSHLFQGALTPIFEAEAQTQHALLAQAERLLRGHNLLGEKLAIRRLVRLLRRLVLDEVPEVAVLLLADRRLEGDRLLAHLAHLANALRSHL